MNEVEPEERFGPVLESIGCTITALLLLASPFALVAGLGALIRVFCWAAGFR